MFDFVAVALNIEENLYKSRRCGGQWENEHRHLERISEALKMVNESPIVSFHTKRCQIQSAVSDAERSGNTDLNLQSIKYEII